MHRILLIAFAFVAGTPVRAEEPAFLPDVAPVVVSRCVSCHGDVKARGEYRLDNFANLLKPGASDTNPIVPGKPDESELYRRLVLDDPKKRMPPGDDPLTSEEIATIKKWIAAGGKFDGNPAVSLKSILPTRKHPAAPEKYPTPAPVCAIAFSPDGMEIAVGGVNEVTIWDAANGKLLRRLPRQPARIHALAYSSDGKRVLLGGGTVGEYGEAALIDATTGNRDKVFGPFDDLVLSVAFAPDGQRIVAGSADRTARCFSAVSGEEVWRSSLHSDWVTGVAFSPGRLATSRGRPHRERPTATRGNRSRPTTDTAANLPCMPQLEVFAVQFDSSGTAYSVGAGTAVRVWHPVKGA
ncbi:MAG: c-type cytochrome domain-containing protein [Gemmataceae bacterium]